MSVSAWVLALASSFCFGLALVLTQFGLRHLEPKAGAAISVPSATLSLACVSVIQLDWHLWQGEAVLIFAGVGLLFPATVTILTFEANRRMGPNIAGAIGNLAPMFAVVFAILFTGDRPQAREWLGLLAIVAGVTLLSLRPREPQSGHWPLWMLLLPLGAALVRGVTQPIIKIGLGLWSSPLAAILIGYCVSSMVVAAALLTRPAERSPAFNRPGIAWFAAVGVTNGLAVFLLYAALEVGSVALVSPLVATYPLVTLLLTALVARAVAVGPTLVLAIVLTVLGVALLSVR